MLMMILGVVECVILVVVLLLPNSLFVGLNNVSLGSLIDNGG